MYSKASVPMCRRLSNDLGIKNIYQLHSVASLWSDVSFKRQESLYITSGPKGKLSLKAAAVTGVAASCGFAWMRYPL